MTFTISNTRPRNPLVAAAMFRRAGSHRRGGNSRRQQAQRDLLAELGRADRQFERRSAATRDRHSP